MNSDECLRTWWAVLHDFDLIWQGVQCLRNKPKTTCDFDKIVLKSRDSRNFHFKHHVACFQVMSAI